MKTVLLAWELGANLGHVGPLLRLARELRRSGHRPVFALRDVVGPRAILRNESIPVLPAPRAPQEGLVRGRPLRSTSYADVLALFGYADVESLAALVRSWDDMFALVKPDLIIADHSPTACLAAYGTIPVAIVGTGYTVPPVHEARFPPLYPDRPPLMSEPRILENISAVQQRRGRLSPATLPALFAAAVRAVATLPQLDPYREVRREPLTGPLEALPPPAPAPLDARVFAYLGDDHPNLEAIVQCLAEYKAPVEAYLRGNVAGLRRFLSSRGAQVHSTPPPLGEVLPRAALVVSHAGSATAHAAMACGRPQLLFPTHAEADLTAEALVSLGTALSLPLQAARVEIEAGFRQASLDWDLRDKAASLSAAVASDPRPDALASVSSACLKLLS